MVSRRKIPAAGVFLVSMILALLLPSSSSLSSDDVHSRRDRKHRGHVVHREQKRKLQKTKGSMDAPVVAPVDQPSVSYSTKTPTRSPHPASIPADLVPPTVAPSGNEAWTPEPTPQADTTMSPVETNPSPTEVPNVEAGATTPSPSLTPSTTNDASGLLSPVEVAEERSRTRSLLPFSLDLSGQFRIDDVDRVVELYLFQRLYESFSNLEWVLLTATSADQRLLVRKLQETTIDFSGVAIFLDPEQTIPTELDLQRAQLQALEDFHFFNEFIGAQEYTWQIDTINLDGMTIDKDGIMMGGNEMVNDGDSLVQGPDGTEVSEPNRLALSLSVLVAMVFVGMLAGVLLARKRRLQGERNEEKETYEGLIRTVDHGKGARSGGQNNISYESSTVATLSFDSAQVSSTTDHRPDNSSNMDWNRVFALSQNPVEQTRGEVFEPKKMSPPKATKTHEIVMLAPVAEGGGGDFHLEDERQGDEDSYGYDTLPDEGINESFVLSSPVAPSGMVEDAFVPSGDHYNQDRDLTIDLSDFHIGGKNSSNS